jgi:hypothetical protein
MIQKLGATQEVTAREVNRIIDAVNKNTLTVTPSIRAIHARRSHEVKVYGSWFSSYRYRSVYRSL